MIWFERGAEQASMDLLRADLEEMERAGVSALIREKVMYYATRDPIPKTNRWTFIGTVYYVFTIITTTGYGSMYPRTWEGRLFTILIAMIGITLTVYIISLTMDSWVDLISWVDRRLFARKSRPSDMYLMGSLIFVLCVLAGAGIWEGLESWGYMEALYFVVMTITTIGLGDLTPSNNTVSLLFCILMLTIPLSLWALVLAGLGSRAEELVENTLGQPTAADLEEFREKEEQERADDGLILAHRAREGNGPPGGYDTTSIQAGRENQWTMEAARNVI